jgi:xanthine/uracil/vitamin C permease (AzgA family)
LTSSGRGSTIATEVRAGAATFLTMAYILFVNPQILLIGFSAIVVWYFIHGVV